MLLFDQVDRQDWVVQLVVQLRSHSGLNCFPVALFFSFFFLVWHHSHCGSL